MKTRIILGAVMIAVLLGVLALDWYLEDARVIRIGRTGGETVVLRGLPVAVVLLLLSAQAVLEMARFCAVSGVLILARSAVIGAAGLGTLPLWWQFVGGDPSGAGVILLLAAFVWLIFIEQMIFRRTADAVRTIACTMLTVLYLGLGGAMILQIRMFEPDGLMKLVLFLAAVKCTDIGAYFTGSAIGRHKLIPWLSPGKSWEGLAGGLAAAAGVSVFVVLGAGIDLAVWQAAVFGVVIGLFGQFGDLCESLFKRAVKLKDSATVVPEFGGILDIVDSPLLAAPAAYALLAVM